MTENVTAGRTVGDLIRMVQDTDLYLPIYFEDDDGNIYSIRVEGDTHLVCDGHTLQGPCADDCAGVTVLLELM